MALAFTQATAQLSLTRVSLDVTQYPKVTARVRATNSGSPVDLSASQFSLLESNIAHLPATVTPEGNGTHRVEWTNSQFGFVSVTLIAIHNGSTAQLGLGSSAPMTIGGRVIVRDSMSRNLPYYVDFETVPAGTSDTVKLKIVCTEGALEGSGPAERPIRLESVTTKTSNFKVVWKGSFGTPAPPCQIISPLEYRIDLICTPTNDGPLSDVLTVTWEGGMRTDVMLSANPTTYPQRTILNVISPNGGERFAPCQEIPVKWSGMISGFYAYVDVSLDNGRSWTFVDSTLDSTLLWRAPSDISDSVRIKVYQKFQSTNPMWLRGEQAPALSASYSADSRYLLVGYATGTIIEWDAVTGQRVQTYLSGTSGGLAPRAVAYIGRTRDFVAVAMRENTRGGEILKFTQGTSNPSATVNVPSDIEVREVGTDQDGTKLYLLPQFAGRIPVYDPSTLAPLQPLTLTSPAASSALNGNTIGVSQLSGEIVTFDATSGVELRRSNTGIANAHGPYTHRFATSLNGRLVALAGKRLEIANGSREQRTFIYDMQLGSIVKILYRETSDAVNMTFSPSDAFLGLGFEFNPQFAVYDLMTARTLPPSGTTDGHSNKLTDLAFAPDGSTLVSTSIDSMNNVLLRRVSTPESDISDNVFSIEPVQLSITKIVLDDVLIGTTLDTTITASVCNNGSVPAIFEWSSLIGGQWMQVTNNISADTVLPGECVTISLRATPLDTGVLVDTLQLSTCGTVFRVPIELRSIDRDLVILADMEDFGDVCIGTTFGKRLAVIRNNDNVPVTINSVFVEGGLQAQFRVADGISDLVVPPGGTLEVTVEFLPRQLGYDTANVIIRYAGQSAVSRVVRVLGRGSGADIQLSHRALAFIPEILERDLVVRNASENPVIIDSADITVGEPFTLLTALPLTIAANDSVTLRVRYNTGAVGSSASMHLFVQPCATATDIKLAAYQGTANISAPIIEADPRSDSTSIPITASITENVAYEGVRPFHGVVRVNPRLYLAHTITTTIGTAEIVSQDIVGDQREIRFVINGNFRGTMEIARLVGYAGMAEVDQTPIAFDVSADGFGVAVTETYSDGTLKIILPDPTRRIVDRSVAPVVQQLRPQPASTLATVDVSVTTATTLTVRVLDQQGLDLITPVTTQVSGGEHSIPLDVAKLPPGVHVLMITSTDGSTTTPMVIIR